ncbi:MAG TPA: hypothetical protein VGB16_04025 [candidate division Zixibacteria bacterium]
MKCGKAKKLINGYAELKETNKNSLDSHVAGCPSCQRGLELHKASINMFKQALSFEDKGMSWEGFVEQAPLEAQHLSWLSSIREKMKELLRLIATPVLGPVPAYVFSLFLILVAGLGAYSSLSREKILVLENVIVLDREYLSSVDDGEKTVYLVNRK